MTALADAKMAMLAAGTALRAAIESGEERETVLVPLMRADHDARLAWGVAVMEAVPEHRLYVAKVDTHRWDLRKLPGLPLSIDGGFQSLRASAPVVLADPTIDPRARDAARRFLAACEVSL